jgi:3-deoxy-D-arabino-heptulosonate 7-phosphate (DAHP) synthase class II
MALGHSFLLQGDDYAKSFEDFGANIIRNMFWLMLQMVVVLTQGRNYRVGRVGHSPPKWQ